MQQQLQQTKRPPYITYVYGQIYRAYLDSNQNENFKVSNKYIKNWNKMLNWFKTKKYIKDFKLGKELKITGFNNENRLYEGYLKGIERNINKEKMENKQWIQQN